MTFQVKKSPVGGDGLFAIKALQAGKTILVVERPAFAALDIPFLSEACSNCFVYSKERHAGADRSAFNVQACAGCHTLRYCSKQCQAQSWRRDHKYECKLLGRLREKGVLPNSARILIQMMSAVIHKQNESCKNMQSHYDEMLAAGGERLESLKMMATAVHEYAGKPLRTDTVCNLLARVFTNGLGLTTPNMDTIGLAVDPLIAKANHSCSPNAYVMFDGPRLLLRSMRDIEEDEEITIQYVDVLNCRIRRREELKERYYFECQCPQCDTEENDPLAAGLQAAISDNLAVLRNQRGWRQAIVALKENLFFASQECHCQKQKQPLPSLHHELFIALLSAQRWVEAFQQGLWIYFEIHPIIYPKFIQPTRTVHSYSLAKLAILLHSDEQAQQSGGTTLKLPEPLDLAQVVVLFLTEAEEALVRSHGQDNSLTREAKAKADDMRKQMAGKLLSQPDAQWALLKEFAGG